MTKTDAASPSLLARLREAMFYRLPEEDRAEFAREATFANYPRAGIFALALGAVNLFLGVVPDLFVWRAQGKWDENPAFIGWFAIHAGHAVFSLAFLPLLHHCRPKSVATTTTRHAVLVHVFCWVSLFGMMTISLVHQQITGTITVFLLGMAAFATGFYTTVPASLALMLTSVTVFIVALPFFQASPVTSYSHIVIAADFVAFFWPLSRVTYSHKARDFAHQKIIACQTAQLARTNEELAAKNVELSRANRLKTDLLGLAAHDLRDPLQTIALSAQSFDGELNPGTRELVRGISESARRMSGLIENLLIETESESGVIVLNPQPTDLPRLVAETVDSYRQIAGTKSIALHFSADGSALRAPPAHVDDGRFRQITGNLVSNAVKFSPAGSNVWITLAHAAEGYQLVVRDEGPGFPAADRDRLFAKYQRGSARPTGGETSTGLGLAIVRQLVALHHGQVWADSPGPGLGASFTVIVP
jgi:signal transduction histidine kinase